MVEVGPGEHEGVDDRHRDARLDAVVERAEHVVRHRAVEDELVFDARVDRRDHPRLAVDGEPDMTRERLVDDCVDPLAVERAPFR